MIDQSDAKHTDILHKIVNNTNSSEEYSVITKALFHISDVKKTIGFLNSSFHKSFVMNTKYVLNL